jgi:hypothetical protein
VLGALMIVAAVLLVPMPAWAFGPIAHLDMGLELLGAAGLFGSGVARLIRRFPESFLRGTLDPDRSLAKNLAPYRRHSHNWEHALEQFRHARDESERAAFLGYLCHLAADSVAHNAFVPSRLVEAFGAPTAGHLYWETRLDARLRRRLGAGLMWLADPDNPDHKAFLKRTVKPSMPGRRLQVHLTGLVLKAQRHDAFGKVSDLVDRRSRLILTDDEVLRTRALALAAQREVLMALGDAGALEIDPRGIEAIRHARDLRRDLRGLMALGARDEVTRRIERAHHHYRGLVAPAVQRAPDTDLAALSGRIKLAV